MKERERQTNRGREIEEERREELGEGLRRSLIGVYCRRLRMSFNPKPCFGILLL